MNKLKAETIPQVQSGLQPHWKKQHALLLELENSLDVLCVLYTRFGREENALWRLLPLYMREATTRAVGNDYRVRLTVCRETRTTLFNYFKKIRFEIERMKILLKMEQLRHHEVQEKLEALNALANKALEEAKSALIRPSAQP